jgi:hypothetical protein
MGYKRRRALSRKKVLPSGFEPESSAREAEMIGRTTLQEPMGYYGIAKGFKNVAPFYWLTARSYSLEDNIIYGRKEMEVRVQTGERPQ